MDGFRARIEEEGCAEHLMVTEQHPPPLTGYSSEYSYIHSIPFLYLYKIRKTFITYKTYIYLMKYCNTIIYKITKIQQR